ncbi:unnamed protein product [Closterium sp. NIES-54]
MLQIVPPSHDVPGAAHLLSEDRWGHSSRSSSSSLSAGSDIGIDCDGSSDSDSDTSNGSGYSSGLAAEVGEEPGKEQDAREPLPDEAPPARPAHPAALHGALSDHTPLLAYLRPPTLPARPDTPMFLGTDVSTLCLAPFLRGPSCSSSLSCHRPRNVQRSPSGCLHVRQVLWIAWQARGPCGTRLHFPPPCLPPSDPSLLCSPVLDICVQLLWRAIVAVCRDSFACVIASLDTAGGCGEIREPGEHMRLLGAHLIFTCTHMRTAACAGPRKRPSPPHAQIRSSDGPISSCLQVPPTPSSPLPFHPLYARHLSPLPGAQSTAIMVGAAATMHALHLAFPDTAAAAAAGTAGTSALCVLPAAAVLQQGWFAVVVVAGAVERCMGLATGVAVEIDWVLVLVGDDRPVLMATAMATLGRVELLCEEAVCLVKFSHSPIVLPLVKWPVRSPFLIHLTLMKLHLSLSPLPSSELVAHSHLFPLLLPLSPLSIPLQQVAGKFIFGALIATCGPLVCVRACLALAALSIPALLALTALTNHLSHEALSQTCPLEATPSTQRLVPAASAASHDEATDTAAVQPASATSAAAAFDTMGGATGVSSSLAALDDGALVSAESMQGGALVSVPMSTASHMVDAAAVPSKEAAGLDCSLTIMQEAASACDIIPVPPTSPARVTATAALSPSVSAAEVILWRCVNAVVAAAGAAVSAVGRAAGKGWRSFVQEEVMPASMAYVPLCFNAVLAPGVLMTSFLFHHGPFLCPSHHAHCSFPSSLYQLQVSMLQDVL